MTLTTSCFQELLLVSETSGGIRPGSCAFPLAIVSTIRAVTDAIPRGVFIMGLLRSMLMPQRVRPCKRYKLLQKVISKIGPEPVQAATPRGTSSTGAVRLPRIYHEGRTETACDPCIGDGAIAGIRLAGHHLLERIYQPRFLGRG